MQRLALALILLLSFAAPASAWHTQTHTLLNDSLTVLEELSNEADESIPSSLISRAKAVIIIPNMLKGGFMVGARYGEGVAVVRDPFTGEWGAPGFITTAGASFGFQVGAQAVDLVLLVMTEKGMKGLLKDKFTLGGDISLTAGPVGRYAEAGTDIMLQGEIYSYSRSKGLFGGVSLKGTVLQPNEEKNARFYGKSINAQGIMMDHRAGKLPETARDFMKSMNRLAPPPFNPYAVKKVEYIEKEEASQKPEATLNNEPLNTGKQPTAKRAKKQTREPLW